MFNGPDSQILFMINYQTFSSLLMEVSNAAAATFRHKGVTQSTLLLHAHGVLHELRNVTPLYTLIYAFRVVQ
jgi:hypothetical protein